MKKFVTLLTVPTLLSLLACSEVDSDLERAVVGAVIGCAAGETLVEGRCVEGAVIGAGVGVLTE